MTPDQYRQALSDRGLTQVEAAKALGVNERTSRRYALKGVSDKAQARVLAQLKAIPVNGEKR